MATKLDKVTLLEAQYEVVSDLFKLVNTAGTEVINKYWIGGIRDSGDSIDRTFKRLQRRSK